MQPGAIAADSHSLNEKAPLRGRTGAVLGSMSQSGGLLPEISLLKDSKKTKGSLSNTYGYGELFWEREF